MGVASLRNGNKILTIKLHYLLLTLFWLFLKPLLNEQAESWRTLSDLKIQESCILHLR